MTMSTLSYTFYPGREPDQPLPESTAAQAAGISEDGNQPAQTATAPTRR